MNKSFADCIHKIQTIITFNIKDKDKQDELDGFQIKTD